MFLGRNKVDFEKKIYFVNVGKVLFFLSFIICLLLEIYILNLNKKIDNITNEYNSLLEETSAINNNNNNLTNKISNLLLDEEEIANLGNNIELTDSITSRVNSNYLTKAKLQILINRIQEIYDNQTRPGYLDGVEIYAKEVKDNANDKTVLIDDLKDKKENSLNKIDSIENNTPDYKYLSTLGVTNEIKKLFDELYPIGSIYCTIGDSAPLYGEWELLEEGRVLWSDEEGGGELLDSTLPNIKGNAGFSMATSSGGAGVSGPFYINTSASGQSRSRSDYNYFQVNMNLSRSSSIYKDGADVTPAAVAVKMYKRIG